MSDAPMSMREDLRRAMIAADGALQQALTDLAETIAPEDVCEVCHEQDDTVSCPCGSLPLKQICESCHWTTCPDGGECW